MRFEARVFRLAKDPQCPEENQDSFRASAERGVAAIADGVASGIFSGPWANMLTEAVVAGPPDPADPEALAAWLLPLRQKWQQAIVADKLQWHQRAKMRSGAFSTLLWIELLPPDETATLPACAMRCFAIGDSCLFHVRANQVLRSFPIQQADEFERDPFVVGSMDLKHDDLLRFARFDETCEDGDLLVLCTDAVALWIVERNAQGNAPDWESYWHVTEETWQDEVRQMRRLGQMRYDDATLVLLRVKAARPAVAQPPSAVLPVVQTAPGGSARPSATVPQPAAAGPIVLWEEPACSDSMETLVASPPPVPVAQPPSAVVPVVQAVPGGSAQPRAAVPPFATGSQPASAPPPLPRAESAPPPLPQGAVLVDKAREILAASEEKAGRVANRMVDGLLRGLKKTEEFLKKHRGKTPPKDG